MLEFKFDPPNLSEAAAKRLTAAFGARAMLEIHIMQSQMLLGAAPIKIGGVNVEAIKKLPSP